MHLLNFRIRKPPDVFLKARVPYPDQGALRGPWPRHPGRTRPPGRLLPKGTPQGALGWVIACSVVCAPETDVQRLFFVRFVSSLTRLHPWDLFNRLA